MDEFQLVDLQELIHFKTKYAISIYLPTHLTGTDTREDRIHFKDCLAEAERRLTDSHLRRPIIENLLRPAKELLNQENFWTYQSKTLAVFMGENFFKTFRIPIVEEEHVVVDPQFYIKPILPLIQSNFHFYILSISENHVKMYEGDMFKMKRIHIASMPDGMADALWYKKIQKDLQFHTETGYKGSAERDAIFHGQAPWIDKHKTFIVEYLRQVNTALKHFLSDKTAPLILATVNNLVPLYKEANTYNHLFPKYIEGNPDHLDQDDLHAKAWVLLRPEFNKMQVSILEKYKNLMGSKRFITNLEDIIPAAKEGLIEALFVERTKYVWGHYDYENRRIINDKKDTAENSDLLNLAIIETITKKGNAFIIDRNKMPSKTCTAAVLRYDYIPPHA